MQSNKAKFAVLLNETYIVQMRLEDIPLVTHGKIFIDKSW